LALEGKPRMPYRHLCVRAGRFHTVAMRLPQSILKPFSIPVVFVNFLLAFAILVPMCSAASAPQLVCTPASVRFGTVATGKSETQFVVLTNTGSSSVKVAAITPHGSEFSVSALKLPLTLAAGQSVTLNIAFAPTNNGGSGGKLTFTSNASNPSLVLGMGGTGVSSNSMSAKPASLSFGSVAVGKSVTLPVVLTNTRSWNETLTALQTVGSGLTVSGPGMPMSVPAGQSVTVNVTFTPQSTAVVGGGLFVSGPTLNIPVLGSGAASTVGQLSVGPSSLAFGSVMIGEATTQPATLTATGGAVTISSASSSSGQFSLPGATFPLVVPSGQSVQVNVQFSPQSAGQFSGTLSLLSNASNSQATEALAGTGTVPQVGLSWSPSTSQVSGYNVYRRLAPSGTYAKVNASIDVTTSFVDIGVSAGMTYDYATTAVNSSGQESAYSNQVEIQIP
jgi:Abnormal spindle-like microcephaly-assoc'd, ASPM-SPD-2-Hydin